METEEKLSKWMSGIKTDSIDSMFEFLEDEECLNKKGKKLYEKFWEKYVKESKDKEDTKKS